MSLSAFSDLIIREVLLSGLALNYTFHGLSAGTEYTISVTAATGAGLGTQATITATTLQPTTPGMVHICTHSLTYSSLLSYITFHYTTHLYTLYAVPLYVSAQAIGSHSINVTWSVAEEDAEGVIHYEVQWSLLAADNDDNINTTTMTIQQEGNASSVLVTDLLSAMEYSIQVRALATAGWGQWSHQVKARTGPSGMQ